jgi:hypothetical protein
MSKASSNPPSLQEVDQLFDDVKKESDRGAVLLCAAWLDDALALLLRNRLVDDNATVDKVFGFDQALGTFSSRITMAYCLGLIDERMRKDLDTIRGIRNDFGHVRKPLSFEDQSIKDRCNNLIGAIKVLEVSATFGPSEYGSIRDRLVVTATVILGYLLTIGESKNHISKSTGIGFQMYLDKMIERGAKKRMLEFLNQMEELHGISEQVQPERSSKENA